ncbi:MAG TPA: polysaccharide deacetylase family protein, partial [Verrucomicrobiaceae bacterium]
MAEIAAALQDGKPFSERTLGLSFDDGYESNHRLAFPILREFGLPATIFLCTGFVDGAALPWFLRLENALACATTSEINFLVGSTPLWLPIKTRADRTAAFPVLLRAFKRLTQPAVEDHLLRLVNHLEPGVRGIPEPLRPMS